MPGKTSFDANPTVGSKYQPFRHVAVVGAGTMGSQIAAHCANAGLQVTLLDIAPAEGDKNAIVQKAFKNLKKASPPALASEEAEKRIRIGNFDEHFELIRQADWVIEVVVERLDVKRQVMARIEQHAAEDAVISSNTSGLPIATLAEGRSDVFKRRFLGTHFFNPPRYLKLLEVIPTSETDADVVNRVCYFGRIHLGKGIVIAKDRPYFVGNRVGMYGMMSAVREFVNGEYSIEEVDTLTGTLMGRPKSATFRTADVVGLDVMKHVIQNLHDAVPEDESVAAFEVPEVLERLVDTGALGAKSKAGFYRKEGDVIRSVNRNGDEYGDPQEVDLPGLEAIRKHKQLGPRLVALFEDEGRVGSFFRRTTLDLIGYAARRIPEVADSPSDVDHAIEWGFGWQMGPFRIWDTLGFNAVRNACQDLDVSLPDWVGEMAEAGVERFYRGDGDKTEVYLPTERRFVPLRVPNDEIVVSQVASRTKAIWSNGEAALHDLGEGICLFEFRSKANALGQELISGLIECIDRLEDDPDLRGMVIGNDGSNFTVGANLGEVAMGVAMGQFDDIEKAVARFQQAIQRVRYAAKPIVVATHQRVLGGGCEMAMACPNTVASVESYVGLVELGVGLIPAGTGTTRLAASAHSMAAHGYDNEIQAHLQKSFETVAMATVAGSALEAVEMGLLPSNTVVVMNNDRRLFVARNRAIWLAQSGYRPPTRPSGIKVLGRSGFATMKAAVYQFLEGRFITEYDFKLALEFARVLTGGDLTGAQEVSEEYLLDLERETFMRLLGEEKTQERITHILTTNKPLRN